MRYEQQPQRPPVDLRRMLPPKDLPARTAPLTEHTSPLETTRHRLSGLTIPVAILLLSQIRFATHDVDGMPKPQRKKTGRWVNANELLTSQSEWEIYSDYSSGDEVRSLMETPPDHTAL